MNKHPTIRIASPNTFAIILSLAMLLTSCATPTSHTVAPMSRYDKDTEFAIDERPNGFALTIYYSRYQFIPESSALATSCKAALTSLAWEMAEKRGIKIRPINEQLIRLSMGRNGVTGITSCNASVTVERD